MKKNNLRNEKIENEKKRRKTQEVTYKTHVYLFPVIESLNLIGNAFFFKMWKRKEEEKPDSDWVTELTINPFEYLENLRWRIKRGKRYRRVTKKLKSGIRVVDINLLYPVLEGFPLSEVSEDQRKAYLIQQECKAYDIWGDEFI